MLVEHPFTECAKFLPLKATVLVGRSDVKKNLEPERNPSTYNELFVPQGNGEVSIESHPKVLSIITLIHHDVFQERCLMTEDLG